jgi:hypothetical protein
MAEKIKISDLFDFSDVQDLQELYRRLEQINQIYKELAKNISQESQTINRGIEANVKEVKKLSDALRVAGDIADIKKLSDQIEKQAEVSKKLTAENEKIVQQNTKLKASQKQVNEESKEAERLLKEEVRLKNQISQATGEQAQKNAILKLELQKVRKETKQQAKEVSGLENAYEKLVRETREAKNEAKRLAAQFGQTSPQALKAAKAAKEFSDELSNIDASVGDFQRNVGNYSSALDGIGQGFSQVLELATPFGLALAAASLAIEGIGALAETVQETNQQLSDTALLTGLAGDELNEYTGKVRASAKTFNVEYKEVLQAANVLQKDFGLSGERALDLVNKGFAKGANITDDYLENLKQFSPQLKAGGKSAEDLIDATIIGAKKGLFGTTFLDTIKESGLSIRELTKAQEDALKPLGKARTAAIRELAEQGKSFEAAQKVVEGLNEVNLTAKQTQTIFADVFKGAGEDLGRRGLEILADFENQQKKVNEEITEQEKAIRRVLKVEEELATAEVKLGAAFKSTGQELSVFFKELQVVGIEGILSLVEETKDVVNELTPIFNEVNDSLSDLGDALGLTGSDLTGFFKIFKGSDAEIAKTIFKFILTTVNLFTKGLTALIEEAQKVGSAIIDLSKSFGPLNFIITETINIFNKFTSFFTGTPKLLNGFVAAAVEAFNQFNKSARSTLSNVGDLIVGVLSFDKDKIKTALTNQTKTFFNNGVAIALAFKKGFEQVEIPQPLTSDADVKKAKDKAKNKIKEEDKNNKPKDLDEDVQLNKDLELLKKRFAQEESVLKDERINQIKSEQEFQDDLLILKVQRLEAEKELLKQSGKDTAAVQKQIDDVLLDEQRKSEKAFLDQQKKAIADEKKIDDKKKADKLKQDREEREERAELFDKADPLFEAAKERQFKQAELLEKQADNAKTEQERDALLAKAADEREKAELRVLFIEALTSGLRDGKTTTQATTEAVSTVAIAKAASTIAGFHDGGYTGDGNEYNVAGVVHKGEHVITKAQTNKYGLKGLTANDLDKAIETGYFNQFADTNNTTADNLNINKNIIVNNDNKEIVSKLDQLINAMPKEQLKEVGGLIQHVSRVGQIKKTTTFRSVR